MNELDDLLIKFSECGITDMQSRACINIIVDWINEEYPVMGAIVYVWLKKNGYTIEANQFDLKRE